MNRWFPFKGTARRNLLSFCLGAGLNDAGEEMYAPYLPLFAATFLHATPEQYGLIEGLAESLNRALRLVTGAISDRIGRKPPVIIGYILIAASRLGLPLATGWAGLIPFRALRQVGRSMRDPAREASIAESVPPEQRGKAFGLLNSLDTVGAVLGPVLGFLLLSLLSFGTARMGLDTLSALFSKSPGTATAIPQFTSWAYHRLFLFAAIPTFLSAIAILFLLKETRAAALPGAKPSGGFRAGLRLYAESRPLMLITAGNAILAVGAAPVSMILLYAYAVLGATPAQGMVLFISYSLSMFLSSYPAGFITDHIGRRRALALGDLLAFASIGLVPFIHTPLLVCFPLVLHGAFESLWIASRRAVVSDLAPPEARAQALGTFSTVYGFASFLSPILLGFLWHRVSPLAGFGTAAVLCLVSLAFLAITRPRPT